MRSVSRALFGAGLVVVAVLAARPVAAQTPSPLANWQYSVGEVLVPLGGPVPDWRVTVGAGADLEPIYEGSKRYSVQPSVVLDVRYKSDILTYRDQTRRGQDGYYDKMAERARQREEHLAASHRAQQLADWLLEDPPLAF